MSAVPMAALPDRWFRTMPDSALLAGPRLLARSLIDVAVLDDRIRSYERLTATPADLRMPIPDFGGLELAAVGNMLLIASARPFTAIQRQTAYSVIVPSLDGALGRLNQVGATVLEPRSGFSPAAAPACGFPTARSPNSSSTAPTRANSRVPRNRGRPGVPACGCSCARR